MNLVQWKVAVKRSLLPDKSLYLRTPFGLAAGSVVHVNPQRELRHYFGLYETQLIPIYRRLLKKGMNVFDVGSSTGYDAVGFAQLTGGKVVAFEAIPALVTILQEVASRNDLCIAIEAGYVGDGKTGDSFSLDAAARRHFFPDFVKMDIEGWEALALQGCEEILASGRSSFVIETHGPDVDAYCFEILQSHRYYVECIEPNRSERKGRVLVHNRWLVATPRSNRKLARSY